ncbi:MAG: NAD(P)-dependent dehydrogenase (short-subunit alcohol dehydrogenase family) [Verrucomicrobiales bacterium]|jgi:NAD(P)-dependent dehydrogenase (short-subunit alcohol dehydrogenase family)
MIDPLNSFRLDGKVVIITGASSGLGERFARVCDAAGASVVLAARRLERLEALAGSLSNAIAVRADFSTDDAAPIVVDAAVSNFGAIDVVVNNAGISRTVKAIEDTMDGFRHELQVDLVGPYDLASRSAKWMIENGRGGAIVNIASVLGRVAGGPLPLPGYAAAKGGLVQLTRELASQWARKGIRVNAIGPGWFESEMTADAMFADEKGAEFVKRGAPMGRAGAEHELDGALLFLASDASTYVTGQTLFVDGGWTIV